MDAQEQQFSCLAPQTYPDQELPNYILIMYTDGLAYPPRSLAIEILASHPTSEKQ